MWNMNFDYITSDIQINNCDILPSHRWNYLRHEEWIKRNDLLKK